MKRLIYILILILALMTPATAATTETETAADGAWFIVKIKQSGGMGALSSPLSELEQRFQLSRIRQVYLPVAEGTMSSFQTTALYVVRSDSAANGNADATAQAMARQPGIDYAEPLYPLRLHETGGPDPYSTYQYYLHTPQLQTVSRFPARHTVLVALVDSGIDRTHPELAPHLFTNQRDPVNGLDDDANGYADDYQGYNFYGAYINASSSDSSDGVGHGTHLAGLIAATPENALGIEGLNSRVSLLSLRFVNSKGAGNQFDAAMAIYYAVAMGADIINCSWGYYRYNTILKEAVQYALSRGVIMVAASGNDGIDRNEYPAGFDGVIAVAAIEQNLQPSYYTNSGHHIDFAMFGTAIYSTLPNNGYGFRSGTSQSTALVTGVIARLLSFDPGLKPAVYSLLTTHADDVHAIGKDTLTGYGLINTDSLYASLAATQPEPQPPAGTPTTDATVSAVTFELTNVLNFPNPVRDAGTKFGFHSTLSGEAEIRIFSLSGAELARLTAPVLADDNAVPWDGRDKNGQFLNNGTYLYVVTVSAAGEQRRKTGKLAILR